MDGLRGLYAIVDLDACERARLEPIEVARAFFEAEVSIVQLRAKGRPDARVVELLEALVGLRGARATRVLGNDRPDLAHLAGADGVHLGQDDFPLALAREKFPRLALGLSTHSEPQLRAALALRPDYVALGPLRATRSKERPEPVVSEGTLLRCGSLAKASGVPLVGIGGLDRRTIPDVAPHLRSIALISALLEDSSSISQRSSDPYALLVERVREYDALIRRSCSNE